MLQPTFIRLASKYSGDAALQNDLWAEVEKHYSAKGRYYHTLGHLENLLKQLSEFKTIFENWEAALFAMYYHDIIYNPLNSDNEGKSAELAVNRMRRLSVDDQTIELCRAHILATKAHQISDKVDTNLFTDADLSVLGLSWKEYSEYYRNVRKEYSVYPDMIYVPGVTAP